MDQQQAMVQQQQQAMAQQEQMSNPQMGQQQQMMLCPVRLVYESPIMMSQGDQMQQIQPQNQAIFINPQNPPPWMRPVQNQVIYVQQMPNNLVPIQQNIDPNLYMQQNFVGYPQMMQQQIVTNPQEQIRYNMQIPNIIQPNMIQNIPLNRVNQVVQPNNTNQPSQPNVQTVVDDKGNVIANYQHMQQNQPVNVIQNIPQNQYIVNNRQIVNNVQNLQQNVASNQIVQQIPNQVATAMVGPQKVQVQEISKQNVYKNVAPQMNQQQMIATQHIPQAMNQMQHIQNLQMQNTQQIRQTFVPNIRTSGPIQVQNMPNVQQTFVNPMPNMQQLQQPVERQVAPDNIILSKNNGSTVSYTAVRNGQAYTYRAIQPRPQQQQQQQQQFRNVPNLLPMTVQNQTSSPRPMAPMNQGNSGIRNVPPTSIPNQNVVATQIKTEFPSPSNNFNRKRKSESPDEIQKKIPANKVYGTITVTPKPPIISKTVQSNDMSNSYPNRNQHHMLQIKPMEVQMNKVNEDPNKTPVNQQMDRNISVTTPSENKSVAHLIEKEKLIRNTVFTQARGRLHNDKSVQNNVNAETNVKPTDITTAFKTLSSPTKNESVQTMPIQAKVKTETPKRELKFTEPSNIKANANIAMSSAPSSNVQNIYTPTYVTNSTMTVNPVNPTNSIMKSTNSQTTLTSVNTSFSINQINSPPPTYTANNQIWSNPVSSANQITTPVSTMSSQTNTNLIPQINKAKPNESDTILNTNSVWNSNVNDKTNSSPSINNQASKAHVYDFNPKEEPHVNYKQNRARIVEELAKKLNKQAEKPKEQLKANEPSLNNVKTEEIPKSQNQKIETKMEEDKNEIKKEIKVKDSPVKPKAEVKAEITAPKNVKNETKPIQDTLEQDKRNSLSQQINDLNKTNNDCRAAAEAVKKEESRKDYKNISMDEMTGKEVHISDKSVIKEDRDYILTHVLDGYVIQESNAPFAIRKPLKEKMLYTNVSAAANVETEVKQETTVKETVTKDVAKDNTSKDSTTKGAVTQDNATKESTKVAKDTTKGNANKEATKVNSKGNTTKVTASKESAKTNVTADVEMKDVTVTKENKKIMEISNLKLNEESKGEKESENKTENDNPFTSLQHNTVKNWTIDELSSHLSRFNWTDTISKIQEHEIDGESLFLASRPQLISIGINEEHADFICDFVRS